MQNNQANPRDKWTAPEHSRGHSLFRTRRDIRAPDGTVIIKRNTLIMGEPDILRLQREYEQRKKKTMV